MIAHGYNQLTVANEHGRMDVSIFIAPKAIQYYIIIAIFHTHGIILSAITCDCIMSISYTHAYSCVVSVPIDSRLHDFNIYIHDCMVSISSLTVASCPA